MSIQIKNDNVLISDINSLQQTIGGGALATSAQTLIGAINENYATINNNYTTLDTKFNSYLPLTGGTMTGPLSWEGSTALPEFTDVPVYLLGIEAFADGGTTKWKRANAVVVKQATDNVLKTGDTMTGDLTLSNALLKVTKNGNTVTIGSQNDAWCHFQNSKSIPFYFGNPIHVNGDLIFYNNGNYSLQRGGLSCAWVNGRDYSIIKSTSINGYSPTMSVKTKNGSWEIGAYDNASFQNMLIFSYVTDANHSSGNNTSVTARITSAGAFTNASQRKLKENIKLYTNSALDKINDISICSFNMKDDPNKDFRVGFIADDTDSIFSGRDHNCMDLNNCIGMILKAIQELDEKFSK